MTDTVASVGFLMDDTQPPDPEQQAALEAGRHLVGSVDTVSPHSLVEADASVDADVLWWHRGRPVDQLQWLADCRPTIQAHLEAGGGLLLSGRALEAVVPFGIDPIAPIPYLDVGPTGLYRKSMYADHPLYAGLEGSHLDTCAYAAPGEGVRFGRLLPARGEVLGSAIFPDHEAPHDVTTVGWRVGDGGVLGIGAGIRFVEDPPEPVAHNRDVLTANALEVLAAGAVGLEGRPKSVESLSADRDRVRSDPAFPRYHLTPPANWLNDPNGLIERDGTYHAFYQYNPGGPYHGTIHWGHAVSDDLITWSDRPVALTPSPTGPDRDGCWSGCAVPVGGDTRIVYTGGRGNRQLPCVATAVDDALDEWEKADANPVIESIPEEPPLRRTEDWDGEFRDHCLLEFDGTWHHIIGSGVADGPGTALVYTCPDDDLTDWTYRGPMLTGDRVRDGDMWECPELLTFEDVDVLHVSNYETVRYFVGSYDPETCSFDVETTGCLDHGCWYAPQSLVDDRDTAGTARWLTWGWLKEGRDERAQWDAGWSGALSLPRVIDLDDAGRIRQRPAPELEALRERSLLAADEPQVLTDEDRSLDASGRHLEIEAEIRLDDAREFGLVVGESDTGTEETPIRYTRENELVVERAHSSPDHRVATEPVAMPITPVDDALSLRLFFDGSILECFANDRHCLSTRIYPGDGSDGLSIYAEDGRAVLESLSVWELGSAWASDGASVDSSGSE